MKELEEKLPLHKVVPLWTLPDKHGATYNLARRRGRAHFLMLVCAPDVDPSDFVQALAPSMTTLRSLPAEGIVVVSSEDIAGQLGSLPFTVLVDTTGKVRDQYLSNGAAAGLFVLDRYADLYHQWLVASLKDLPSADEVKSWIEAVGMQCSV